MKIETILMWVFLIVVFFGIAMYVLFLINEFLKELKEYFCSKLIFGKPGKTKKSNKTKELKLKAVRVTEFFLEFVLYVRLNELSRDDVMSLIMPYRPNEIEGMLNYYLRDFIDEYTYDAGIFRKKCRWIAENFKDCMDNYYKIKYENKLKEQ